MDDQIADDHVDLTSKIERLDLFEERIGVRLESLSAFIDTSIFYVYVRGELHPRDGMQLDQDVELVVAAYDENGRIVGTTQLHFSAENFFGFETFECPVQVAMANIIRVRVYPTRPS